MQLSPEQEAAIIEENMVKIYRAIDNFTVRCPFKHIKIDYDDYVGEVSLVFLQHIRKCETMEEINKFPWYDAMHAMTEFVLNCQPLSVPKDTKRFSQLVAQMPETVSIDLCLSNGVEVDGMSKSWVVDKETQIDFDGFMSGQDEFYNRITGMKLLGARSREIAKQCGVTEGAISKRFSRLRECFDEYFKEDEDE